ncbi:uncharacterized protein MYCFIDRAFT_176982 [Pseudocercospora fijiensis CIRAD86]|uniref:Uncharacterized protein n=1 Tax=Pseudocercospora fijiensis (strain CIRAD86) TaxID=383855 RepID=M3A5S7_PSEFD|nr:uncharacterized protein MYCFIDRAFT_176982 [Pseudocercospora fijiensis CIRAD86]EME79981.1 hypothetical protein MYCFIDRAFT_176982 [Pseudocercospora fijiensis CIRAD86]
MWNSPPSMPSASNLRREDFHISGTGKDIPNGHTIALASVLLGLAIRGVAEIVSSRQAVDSNFPESRAFLKRPCSEEQ